MHYSKPMNGIHIRIASLVGCLILAGTARASIEENNSRETSYRTIVDRNPFGLKPPPPPAPPPSVAPPPKGDIKLTGITAFGVKKAYFMVADTSKAGKMDYYSLGVDDKKDGLEVVEIDEVSKSVKIRNGGIETLLTFASHGIAPPASAAAPATPVPAPGAPGAPGGSAAPIITAGAKNVVTPAMLAAGNTTITPMRNIPSRSIQGGSSGQYQTGGMAQRYGLGQAPNNPVAQQPAAPQNNLSTEEQILMLELQKVANPHLPPTPGLPMPDQMIPVPNQPGPGLPGQVPPGMPGLPGRRVR